MYQVVDLSNDEIIDEFQSKREAEREAKHLNGIHNPPSYIVRKVKV